MLIAFKPKTTIYLIFLLGSLSCAYFNTFYNAKQYYEEAEKVLDSYNDVPDRRLWARAYKGRAITAAMSENKEVAADFTRRSLMFWPGQADMSWGFNMETSRLLRSVKVEWDTTPHGGVEIVTVPGEAEVFIDGRSRGFSRGSSSEPFAEEQLQTGVHHILVVKDGYVAQNHWVEVVMHMLLVHRLMVVWTE